MKILGILKGLLAGLSQSPKMLGFADELLQAWNAHDAPSIARLLADGRYRDPLSQAWLTGEAMQAHAQALFKAFPRLQLTLSGALAVGDNTVMASYRLQGRHDGALPGGLGIDEVAATGRRLDLEASLCIRFEPAGPRIENHFAVNELAEQLGFLALLMPREQGAYQFGAYYRLNRGNQKPPQAIGMTWLQVKGGQQAFDQAATVTNQVLESFAGKPGFVTGIIGARPPDEKGESAGFTLSAWEDLEALESNLLPNKDHQQVVHQFMKEGLAYATHSRVYTLVRAKPVMIACENCGKKNNAYKKVRICSACKEALAEAPAYW